MRIAILGPYPLDRERLGGVEVAIVYAQQQLLKIPGVELHIVTCLAGLSEPRVMREDRLTITFLPRKGMGRITGHRHEIRAILDVLAGFEPDVVHAHTSGLYAGAALASPYPSVITVHGIAVREARLLVGWQHKLRGLLDTLYERRVMRRTRHLMSITPYVDKVFKGVFSGRSYLVENACEERFFDIERQPVPGRLLFAGPVVPRKGVLPLIQAVERVRAEYPHVHLHIAGSLGVDAEYGRACQTYMEEHLPEAVTFLGHLSQERVIEEYGQCEVVVLPSLQETAPMVIEQAMAAGVPSVATRAGGVPWMLDEGVTGLTLPLPESPEGEPRALADALLCLLRDPVAMERMGAAAKEQAEARFRSGAVARRTYEVYQRVIEAGR